MGTTSFAGGPIRRKGVLCRHGVAKGHGGLMRRRTILSCAAVASLALMPLVLAVTPANAMTDQGSHTWSTGGGKLRVSWVGECNSSIANGATVGTWAPTIDVKVAEKRDTTWKDVRITYKLREIGETFLVDSVTGNIADNKAKYTPPRYDFGSQILQRSDDAF